MGLCGVRADMMRSACEGCAECVRTWCGAYAQGVRSLSVGSVLGGWQIQEA